MSGEIIFVYNAKSGIWNGLLDSLHKISSPETYSCELCQLTYGLTTMNREWKSYLRNLPYKITFLHLDELSSELPKVEFPAAFIKGNNGYEMLITKEEMRSCNQVKELIFLMNTKLEDYS
ncbi:GTPase [Rossellomorea vietnamensis]|uniref:GTPase n=1 Tax=Rossellomorea vietnamensis TaxID=218284 RepID=A0A5D4K819_9BACI|nr:GTPase [Rossellomorea vietnamensis]TYR73166.1 GTPase [Rossellomorea vietnamensis]